MLEVKICGITNPADARLAAACGAKALGFIFYPGSPRYLPPDRAQEIMEQIPKTMIRVGVFVNQPAETIRTLISDCGLHLIQLHGDESPEFCGQFDPGRVIKAFAPRNPGDLEAMNVYRVRAVLIDARRPGIYGGSGEMADWTLARKAGNIRPLILAGGLREDNVAEAVRWTNPLALDLNSGVETRPGIKDPHKVKRIMHIIRGLTPTMTKEGTKPLFQIQER